MEPQTRSVRPHCDSAVALLRPAPQLRRAHPLAHKLPRFVAALRAGQFARGGAREWFQRGWLNPILAVTRKLPKSRKSREKWGTREQMGQRAM
jgi:hypothetical protein